MMAKTLNLCAIISAYSDLMIELRVIWQNKHLEVYSLLEEPKLHNTSLNSYICCQAIEKKC